MSKKIEFLLCIVFAMIFVFISCTPEDGNSPIPEDFFIKFYGSSNAEVIVDILPYESGYLLLGSTNNHINSENPTGSDLDYLLIKTDESGNQTWKQNIGFSFIDADIDISKVVYGQDTPSEMILYDNNTVAIIGTTSFNYSKNAISLTRIFVSLVDIVNESVLADSLIFPLIQPILSDDEPDSSNTVGNSILRPIIDGNEENKLILLGSTDLVDTTIFKTWTLDDQEIYMSKVSIFMDTDTTLTATTDTSWPIYFGFPGYDEGVKISQAENSNNYSIIASTESMLDGAGGGLNVGYYNLDFNGSDINHMVFGNSDNGDDIPSDMFVDGNKIAILGNSTGTYPNGSAFIMEITTSGTEIIKMTNIISDSLRINGNISSQGNTGFGIIKDDLSNYFVTGQLIDYVDPGSNNKGNDIVIYKLDQFGEIDLESINVYGGIGNDVGRIIFQSNDIDSSGELIIGATVDFQGGTTMMSLIKTNRNGEFAK